MTTYRIVRAGVRLAFWGLILSVPVTLGILFPYVVMPG